MSKEYDKWDGSINYPAGAEVEHHGVHYRARKPVYNAQIVPNPHDEIFWEKTGSTREYNSAPAKVSVATDTSSKT